MNIIKGIFSGITSLAKGAFVNLTGVGSSKPTPKERRDPEIDPDKYITSIDEFAPPEPEVEVKREYHYNYGGGEIDIGTGYEALGEDIGEDVIDNEDDCYEDNTDEDDLWEEEVKVSREDVEEYREKMSNIKEKSPEFEEVVKYYRDLEEYKGKDKSINKISKIKEKVYNALPLEDITQLPTFLNTQEEVLEKVVNLVKIDLPKEEIEEEVRLELARYRSIFKEFVSIKEEGDVFIINDWKLGIKYIDFIKENSSLPEMMLILTRKTLSEIVATLREGYMPNYLRGTAFEKLGFMTENYIELAEEGKIPVEYNLPKAFETYKRGLGMYSRLRNKGKLADVNNVLDLYYKRLDKAEPNEGAKGDVYLGLVEPNEVLLAYIEFIYGRAKQSEAMSEFIMRLMQENPKIVEVLADEGYVEGDNPKGVVLYFTGHIVIYVKTGKGKYNILFNKAPSDILAKDVKTIADKFSKDWGKVEKKVNKSKKKSGKVFPGGYDYNKAMEFHRKNKNKK